MIASHNPTRTTGVAAADATVTLEVTIAAAASAATTSSATATTFPTYTGTASTTAIIPTITATVATAGKTAAATSVAPASVARPNCTIVAAKVVIHRKPTLISVLLNLRKILRITAKNTSIVHAVAFAALGIIFSSLIRVQEL